MPTHMHTKIMSKRTHPRHRHNLRGRPHQHAPAHTLGSHRQQRRNPVDNSHQHPPITITTQRPSAWEGMCSPGPPEQTPWGAPPSRRAALLRAHPHTPDSSSGSSHHVRAHTGRRHRKHRQPSEGATCAHIPPGWGGGLPHAVTVLRATLPACRQRILEARGPLLEKGAWEKG